MAQLKVTHKTKGQIAGTRKSLRTLGLKRIGTISQPIIEGHEVEFVTAGSLRTALLINSVGSVTKTAELLGVSKSQPGRWRDGKEAPSPAKLRELLDLDHVYARASMLWPREVVMDWMVGSNGFLNGARPIDVLRIRGVSEVMEALEAAEQGAIG